MAKQKVSLSNGKKRLAILWMSFVAFIFIIVLVQSFTDNFGSKLNEAWGWFFQNTLPSLSLIISVFVIDSQSSNSEDRQVDIFYFRLCKYISLAYLFTILITLLAEPVATSLSEKTTIQFLDNSSLWLAPFQGIVTSSLGIFFIKKEEKE